MSRKDKSQKFMEKMLGIISQSKNWFSCYCVQLMFSVEKHRVNVAQYNTLDTFLATIKQVMS